MKKEEKDLRLFIEAVISDDPYASIPKPKQTKVERLLDFWYSTTPSGSARWNDLMKFYLSLDGGNIRPKEAQMTIHRILKQHGQSDGKGLWTMNPEEVEHCRLDKMRRRDRDVFIGGFTNPYK